MTKIEKKVIAFVEKNIILLVALFLTGLALFLRRQGIWYYSQDYIHYYDMHENSTLSALFYFVVQLLGYGFDIPLHGVKWLAGLADFAVAALCVMLCGRELRKQGGIAGLEKLKLLLLYAGCLFAPVIYIRGCIWSQMDSLGFAFLLGALYLTESKKQGTMVGAVLLAIIGVALCPYTIVVVEGYFFSGERIAEKKTLVIPLVILAVAMLLNGIAGLLVSTTWQQGVQSFLNWTTYHPYTGERYAAGSDWLWQMIILGGYGLALYSGLAAFRKKMPYALAVAIQLAIAICYGIALGWS